MTTDSNGGKMLSPEEMDYALRVAREWAEYEPGALGQQWDAYQRVTVGLIVQLSRALLDAHYVEAGRGL